MIAHDLREDTDAFETALCVRTHVVETEIDRFVVDVHREPFEDLLSAVEADGVGVGAGGALGEVHHPRGILIHLHVRHAAKVDAVFGRGGGGVVLHQHAAGVAILGLGGAVAQPDEIPAVTVGGERLRGFGGVEEGLGAESDTLELSAEIDVPVGVVLHDEGAGEAFVDDLMGEVHVTAPAADDAVFALTFFKHLLGFGQHSASQEMEAGEGYPGESLGWNIGAADPRHDLEIEASHRGGQSHGIELISPSGHVENVDLLKLGS